MPPIDELLWPEDRVDHIGRHGVDPSEVEEVCFGQPLVLRARAAGPRPVFYLLGETAAGRHIFCVVIRFPHGKGYPVTARDMTAKEKRRYVQWKRR